MITSTKIESPLGPLLASEEDGALTGLWFIGQRHFPKDTEGWREVAEVPVFDRLRQELDEYFAGTRREFDLPMKPGGALLADRIVSGLVPYLQQRGATLRPETPVVTYVPADKSDLKAGAKVIAFMKKLPDGSFETNRVSVGRDGLTPPM